MTPGKGRGFGEGGTTGLSVAPLQQLQLRPQAGTALVVPGSFTARQPSNDPAKAAAQLLRGEAEG